MQRLELNAVKGGNGGCPLCGNFSGRGFTRRTCYGNHAAFVTSMAGDFKQSAAVWLGTSIHLTFADVRH
jgi:hypothetical protein